MQCGVPAITVTTSGCRLICQAACELNHHVIPRKVATPAAPAACEISGGRAALHGNVIRGEGWKCWSNCGGLLRWKFKAGRGKSDGTNLMRLALSLVERRPLPTYDLPVPYKRCCSPHGQALPPVVPVGT
ncbi:hypothetical protein HaLaN_20490 [Haematococcus lacustris]|uniref:Uncharacterized protein n=1 Tax=Haematococcus lacustris TaxID=44745 RepID=A0A699ZP83_HAELA|nr:hypothetical protein HaLaN_20490 [Haematococcus lacustris]